jgi:hypothetical protein
MAVIRYGASNLQPDTPRGQFRLETLWLAHIGQLTKVLLAMMRLFPI